MKAPTGAAQNAASFGSLEVLLRDGARPEKIRVKEHALSMLDRSSVAIAKTVAPYAVSRKANNVRTLDREDPELIRPANGRE
ncbi:hypothetical protein [Cryobacterium sinapicolor]|uniref:hypothetical protein n=1 Tax=Cryobacterium sinapicolor TaxID=1259236 RepID=UPI0010691D75|nr:hypothetical protein [Cryobacterium sinapicolor]